MIKSSVGLMNEVMLAHGHISYLHAIRTPILLVKRLVSLLLKISYMLYGKSHSNPTNVKKYVCSW